MSKIYGDLSRGRKSTGGPGKEQPDTMDLFSYAARKSSLETPAPAAAPQDVQPPPPEPPEPAIPTEIEVESEPAAPLFRRGLESGRPLGGVLDPLSRARIPLWADRDRKRRITINVIAASVLAIFVVLGGMTLWSRRSRAAAAQPPTPPPPPPAPAARVERPAPAAKPRTPVKPAASQAPRPAAKDTGGLALKVPGAKVKSEGDVRIVTFESGIFLGGVRLSPGGRRMLDGLGKQLAPYGKRLTVTVIGCTDNVPINVGGRFENNQDLGLARANEVARHLQQAAGLPASVFQTVSYGERWSPYPNNTPQNRAKNRTAVLRISAR